MSRANQRPHVEVYPGPLRQSLPCIPLPLAGDDADAQLDLDAIFTAVYDRSGYAFAVDYRRPVGLPVQAADTAWLQSLLTRVEPA